MTVNTMSQDDFKHLAQMLFPDVTQTPAELVQQYPPRDLPAGARVVRFAPSPTGFIHIGGILAALMCKMLANQSDGVYILRVEDTDQKREIEGGIAQIVQALAEVDLSPDEGVVSVTPIVEQGDYGPYIQSQRLDIYHVYIKEMIARGWAYPCFLTATELESIREQQQQQNARSGVYGVWARSRNLSMDEIAAHLEQGTDYVIRLKAPTVSDEQKVTVIDTVRDRLDLSANIMDAVMLKSDGIPTYNFAHVVDDYLMRINLVLRGDEYITSIPMYVQIHEALALPMPAYAHIAPIAKMDGASRRKLSKRKDPEAAMAYYYERGYPTDAILEYLLNLANSTFEDWRADHPNAPYTAFPFELERLGRASALFDEEKFNSVSKEIIAGYDAATVYEQVLAWAQQHQPEWVTRLTANPDYSRTVFDVERGGEMPRKDLANWDDIESAYGVFFDELYQRYVPEGYAHFPEIARDDLLDLLDYFIATAPQTFDEDKTTWVQRLRDYAPEHGYAKRRKDYKNAPEQYKGWFGDMMMVFRVALSGKTQTPDLYAMMRAMGQERVLVRLHAARDYVAAMS